MSSELLNALNPNIVHGRARKQRRDTPVGPIAPPPPTYEYQTPEQCSPPPPTPRLPPPQQYVPHRSELELAIVPPPQPQARRQALVPAEATNPLQEILRMLAATREAAERETQRRIAWEQEQEAKHAQQQAELEKRLMDMQAELVTLKSKVQQPPMPQQSQTHYRSTEETPLSTPSSTLVESPSPRSDESVEQPAPPTPASQPPFTNPSSPLPAFMQGSSSRPMTANPSLSPRQLPSPVTPHISSLPEPKSKPPQPPAGPSSLPYTVTSPAAFKVRLDRTPQPQPAFQSPLTTPSLPPAQPWVYCPLPTSTVPSSPSATRAKKRSLTGTESSYGSDVEDDPSDHKRRRYSAPSNTNCTVLASAVRAHILYHMDIGAKEPLPESHIEGAPFDEDAPIRFVWDKTARQSPHNMTMKNRILSDLKANKHLYPQVPQADFTDMGLDIAFDSAFKTLRSKQRVQVDEKQAAHMKMREDKKAMRSRRRERKKNKLKKRADMRKKLDTFSHPTFDPALTQDCMSSEESCDEYEETVDAAGGIVNIPILRIRGMAWRSQRLTHFYAVLDAEDDGSRPRKATNGKRRQVGTPKEDAALPPKGIASWMISRRWIRQQEAVQPNFQETLRDLVEDSPGFDWANFPLLGAESDDELGLS